MGRRQNYATLGFRRAKKGALEGDTATTHPDADAARAAAERLCSRRGYVGAIAYVYGDADDQDPITLAAFGDVPPEARDVLPF